MTPTSGTAQQPRAGRPTGRAPAGGSAGRASGGAAKRGRSSRGLPPLLPARLDTPLTSYYLVLGATVALTAIGLVMVLSSSSVESYTQSGSAYTVFARQALFAVVGVPLMVLAARLPLRIWRAVGWPLLIVSVLAQLLVFTPLGISVNGNQNWVGVGGFTVQPAEIGKLALIVWAAAVLARKRALVHRPAHALVPVLPATGVLLGLVLLGGDLGTSLIVMAVVGAMLYAAGTPLRVFGILGAVTGALVWLMVAGAGYRMGRIAAWTSGDCGGDISAACWQTTHGKWALATGGWWGVGLGAGRQKWGSLPEAHNDFIFAVIGEELGLVGTLVVLGLFAVLAIGLCRVVLRTDDLFVKIATGGVLAWVLGQAIINIGAVIGMLPVVGLPLPLVSAGGSALVMTMCALGMVIGFARQEPGAREALAARAGLVHRSLAVLPVRREQRGGRGAR